MKGKLKLRNKTIAEQVASMRCRYPQFKTCFTSHGNMAVMGRLQPTSRSDIYDFILKYNLTDIPAMKIIFPVLKTNSRDENIPHLYSGNNFCLYQPKYREFRRSDFLWETIIPWTSLWLYYYEIWHLTGEWVGGGEHPK